MLKNYAYKIFGVVRKVQINVTYYLNDPKQQNNSSFTTSYFTTMVQWQYAVVMLELRDRE